MIRYKVEMNFPWKKDSIQWMNGFLLSVKAAGQSISVNFNMEIDEIMEKVIWCLLAITHDCTWLSKF